MDLFTRWTLYAVPWLSLAMALGSLVDGLADDGMAVALGWALASAVVLAGLCSCWAIRDGLAHYVNGAAPPWRAVWGTAAPVSVALALVATLGATGRLTDPPSLAQVASAIIWPLAIALTLAVPIRTFVLIYGGVSTGVLVGFAAVGSSARTLAATALVTVLLGCFALITVRCSAWILRSMSELDAARDVQARLAVAEERLRFGRDMHDVLGRNLSVIALKSELAVRLARRGSPAAVDHMAEVQRIAQESQREVREVVRGYREADLHTELAGARSVLRAAGVDCRIEDAGGERLSQAVQSALGWVVREGTTNVLRHADAQRCVLTLRVTGPRARWQPGTGTGSDPESGAVVVGVATEVPGAGAVEDAEVALLIVENDGVPAASALSGETQGSIPYGSGLTGLRERLAAVHGTLTAGPAPDDAFRLTARVPLRATAGPADTADTANAADAPDAPKAMKAMKATGAIETRGSAEAGQTHTGQAEAGRAEAVQVRRGRVRWVVEGGR
ncbi:sensor histidine kinase [Streptomyces zagrosensis]|uniref:Two-component system sensor histidine kinase DesK n=1 Tax=Streptomyces zagrosensis TaxID=1042984 RepID=A0A7W9UX20_9ACTN|nr:histidine kinase [Streptomyces zagrosensis]MBB5933811.1 two-component system sensor histidine kinase DesK [Streptomyces zagrosensis]